MLCHKPGTVDVHVYAISLAEQSNSETTSSGWRDHSVPPLVAVPTMVSTLNSTVCGSPSHFTIASRSVASTRIHLRPSARMEALMQHFQAAEFSEAVFRLAAAPRRSSTNRFTHWAIEQGTDPLGPTAAQIATFLHSLFDTHGLPP